MKKNLFIIISIIFLLAGCSLPVAKKYSMKITTPSADSQNKITNIPNDQSANNTSADQLAPVTPSAEKADIDNPTDIDTPNEEYVFDGCGRIQKYEKMDWYKDLVKNLTNIDAYTQSDKLRLQCPSSYEKSAGCPTWIYDKISADYIGELCYSKNGNMVVLSVMGEYGGAGAHLFRYNIISKSLEESTRSSKDWFCPPGTFWKRTGNEIQMSCTSGDGGEGGIDYYSFDFVKNYVRGIKRCPIAENGDFVIENQVRGQEKRCYPID